MACALDHQALEEYTMTTGTKRRVALCIERSSQQWVVRDPEGHVWLLLSVEDPWGYRQPFTLTPASALEPVPGHDTSMRGFPF